MEYTFQEVKIFLVTSLIGFCIHFVFKFRIQFFCLLGSWRQHFIPEANKDVGVEQEKMAIIVSSDLIEYYSSSQFTGIGQSNLSSVTACDSSVLVF